MAMELDLFDDLVFALRMVLQIGQESNRFREHPVKFELRGRVQVNFDNAWMFDTLWLIFQPFFDFWIVLGQVLGLDYHFSI